LVFLILILFLIPVPLFVSVFLFSRHRVRVPFLTPGNSPIVLFCAVDLAGLADHVGNCATGPLDDLTQPQHTASILLVLPVLPVLRFVIIDQRRTAPAATSSRDSAESSTRIAPRPRSR